MKKNVPSLANNKERAPIRSMIVDDPEITSLEVGLEAKRQIKQAHMLINEKLKWYPVEVKSRYRR